MTAIRKESDWDRRRIRDHTPINAKRIMRHLGITLSALAMHIQKEINMTVGKTTISQIMNRNLWPTHKNQTQLEGIISAYFLSKGCNNDDIKTAFEIDKSPSEPYSTLRQEQQSKDTKHPVIDEIQLPETQMLTQAAKKQFLLFKDPFMDDVQSAKDVFLSPDQRYIREVMFQTAKHGGFIAVIGESGAGKTTLRRDLLDRIKNEETAITAIQPRIFDKGRLTAGAICEAIIGDVSNVDPKRSLEAQARQVEELLTGSSRAGNSHVLLIEEAHDLSIPTLKYLKRFWELEDGFKKLLSIILIGQPELKNKLDERQNWDAREVIRRCEIAELKPLNGNLREYLDLKFKRIGKNIDDLFEADAYDALRERLVFRRRGSGEEFSMLYPLVVNNTVIKALNMASEIGADKISADIIKGI